MITSTPSKYLRLATAGKQVFNLIHHFQAYELAFAESDRFLVEDADVLQDVKELLKAKNKTGFDRVASVYLNLDNSLSGIVEDDISPKITKRYAFKITGTKLQYRLVNPSVVANFSENERVEFATAVAPGKKKQAKCVKGVPCDPICLRRDYVCLHDLTPGQKKVFDRAVRKANEARLRAEKLKGSDKELQAQANLLQAEKVLEKKTRQVGKARERNQAKTDEVKPTPEEKKKPDKAGFPDDVSALKTIKQLGGSTGAVLVEDPATGKQYVLKRGASEGHIRSESAADRAYEALGIDVPPHKLYETPDGPVKVAEFIKGRTIIDLEQPTDKFALIKQMQAHFAADALLGNWDVAGLIYDNLLLGDNGKLYRIDNGGALGFRAQGAPKKGTEWNAYPTELWSLRDGNVNFQTSQLATGLTYKDLTGQMEAIAKSRKQLLAAIPDDTTRAVMEKRLDEMERLVKISRTFEEDNWKDDYTDGFSKHVLGLRQAGITAKLPQALTQKSLDEDESDFVTVLDEKGKEFDSLRGRDSIIGDLRAYIDQGGGDHEAVISNWMSGQSGSSWSGQSQALKFYMAQQRETPEEDYYWAASGQYAKGKYTKFADKLGEEVYRDSVQAWHAFNYEMLDKADFKGKDKAKNTVELIRTENEEVMKAQGLSPGDEGVLLKRAVFDSTSVYQSISVHGTEETVQQVPIHRVLGTYWTAKNPGDNDGGFLFDAENEFIAMLDGIRFNYKTKVEE